PGLAVLFGSGGLNRRWRAFDQTGGAKTNSRTSCAQRQAAAVLAGPPRAPPREGAAATREPPADALLSRCGPAVRRPSGGPPVTPPLPLHPAPEPPPPPALGLGAPPRRSLGHVGQTLPRERHRAVIERDQVPRHLPPLCPGGLFPPHLTPPTDA